MAKQQVGDRRRQVTDRADRIVDAAARRKLGIGGGQSVDVEEVTYDPVIDPATGEVTVTVTRTVTLEVFDAAIEVDAGVLADPVDDRILPGNSGSKSPVTYGEYCWSTPSQNAGKVLLKIAPKVGAGAYDASLLTKSRLDAFRAVFAGKTLLDFAGYAARRPVEEMEWEGR